MRPLESASKFVNLALSASLLVGGQAGCDRRDPTDIQRIGQLEGELAARKDEKVEDKCVEVRGDLAKCTANLTTCTKAATAQSDAKKADEASRLKGEEDTKEVEQKKAAVVNKVNKAIEEAGIKNPTNIELISKVFVAILSGNFDGELPYLDISKALGTYDLNSAGESGVLANDYASKMDAANIAGDALAAFAKLGIEDKLLVGKTAGEMIPKLEEAAALYPKYAALFRNGSFKRCMTIGSVWFQTDKDKAPDDEKADFDDVCKDGGLVSQYHNEGPFDRFAMRQMDRMRVSAGTITSTVAKVRQDIFGK